MFRVSYRESEQETKGRECVALGERDTGTKEEAILVILGIHLLSAYCVPGSKPGARNSKGAGRVRVSYQVISDTVLTLVNTGNRLTLLAQLGGPGLGPWVGPAQVFPATERDSAR